MFEIYSIGDANYLSAVLNAIAMISGSGDMKQLAGLGFLIGVLLVMFQGILQARMPPLQNALVAWVVYMGMFGPTTTVTVEDVYSGAVRQVQHVPLGPAAFGAAMSAVGYGVTHLFEQAFSTPAMTDTGFAEPLQVLQKVRKYTVSRGALAAANSPTMGADVERSFVNYIAECTLYEVDSGNQRSIDSIMLSPNWQALAAPLKTVTTELRLGGAPIVKPCDEAWADLAAYTVSNFLPALRKSLAASMSVDDPNAVPGIVQSALDAITGAGVDAQNYMVMSAIVPFMAKAKGQAAGEVKDWSYAAMIEQAAQQRNTQWAAEAKLFSRIVRPMMTFFEAFLFAVSPLMAFAIGLGPVGIKMVGKYLLFGLWIQLWQPILAIINLYLVMSMHGKMDAMQSAAIGALQLPSMYAIYKLDFLLQDYLGIGGMLAASTPAISLMLIYGSAITATHLAGRLQAGDAINENIVSPDVSQPAAALSMSPLKSYTPLTGTITPNANSVLWSANVARDLESSVRSTNQAMEQATNRFSSTLASTVSATASRNGQTVESRSMNWDYSASGSATDSFLQQQGQGLSRKYEQSHLSQDQMAAVVAGALGGRNDSSSKPTSANTISAQLQSQYGVTDTTLANAMAADVAQRVNTDRQFQAHLADSVRADASSGTSNVFADHLSAQESSTLQRDAADVVSASRSVERAEGTAVRYGALGNYGAAEIGNAIAQNPAMMEKLHREIDNRRLTGDHARLAASWSYANNLSPQAADAAAGMALLLGHGDGSTIRQFTPQEQTLAREAGYGILGDTFGAHRPRIDPYSNAALEAASPQHGGTASLVGAENLVDPRGDTRTLRDDIRAHSATVEGVYGREAVDTVFGNARASVAHLHGEASGQLRHQRQERVAALIAERAELPRSAAHTAHNVAGGLATQLKEQTALVTAGVKGLGSGSGYGNAQEHMIDERMKQIAGYGLTSAQQQLYREASGSLFAGLPSDAQIAARQAVIKEAGPGVGEHIATLIERSVGSRDDSDLQLIGTYNDAGGTREAPHPTAPAQPGGRGTPDTPSWLGATRNGQSEPTGNGNDHAYVRNLVRVGSDLEGISYARQVAQQAHPDFPHNGCAAFLSGLMQTSGINVPLTLGAGALAGTLEERGWNRVPIGAQQPGDVGVAYDRGGNPGADHVYLVLENIDGDRMLIADNQEQAPHQRLASGGGKTATEYFLRAPA